MKQLMQKLRDGTMKVHETAMPALGPGMVIVQNHYSLISAGTEGGTVTAARKSLIGKAKERPEQVKQVIDSMKQQGVVQTYRAVSKKLDSYSSLGYSSAGIVIDVGDHVHSLGIGDHVACAGMGYASHAEIVSVPENLCVKLDEAANLAHAAYNTLGAIALQGVRQADLRLGETCVVIGLGLLGQLTCQLLQASGIRVIGLDISTKAVELARRHCADEAYTIEDPGLVGAINRATDGINADAVIITAATPSTQPINLAGSLLRKRGTVVVVGDVPTGFNREPDYYKKELAVKMSCSYGPGRYDLGYEEKGFDYPPGYVRWTENRNMRAFQDLVHKGAIDLDYMTTHRFSIDNASQAYDLILNKTEDYLGLMIEYDVDKIHSRQPVPISVPRSKLTSGAIGIGFIGAGSYAMSHLLPNLPKDGSVELTGVMTSSGTSSRSVAEKYGFQFAAASPEDVVNHDDTGTVFIATRHDTHARYTQAALQSGKNVFVEKPLCLSRAELEAVIEAWKPKSPNLMVGFNRRFAPLSQQIKALVAAGPVSMLYRINAGAIPADSWVQDRDIGGGRVIGEVCHFIDFMVYISGSLPVRVQAESMREPQNLQDTLSINLAFENGSIGSISYFSNGSKSVSKEYVEVYKDGLTAQLRDFRELEIHGKGKSSRKKLMSQDKGQPAMVAAYLQSIRENGEPPISFRELVGTTIATFDVLESLRRRQTINVDVSSF